ncbi:hypothetical protein [Streptomyces bungoensis]|uniref:hypothetical protein n=1 Tax=Streptomyces bungoensis TaxID=285568 RepID=UPI000A5519C6|nr:hypothetical protein [Streptomyces bungoensis]
MSERAEGGDARGRPSHERHEPFAWHEPTKDEQEHTPSHAGNGTVNHGPDAQGPEGSEPGLDGLAPDLDGPAPDPDGLERDLDGLAPDELALRRILHAAVEDIEPRTGTLDHLRRAVPARRARKRQAVVGMAAAALFIGTAIPALIHVSAAGGSDPNTAMAGQTSQTQGGADQGKQEDGGSSGPADSHGKTPGHGKGSGKPGERGGTGGSGTGSSSGANPSATLATGAPLCTAAQLGSATQSVNAADTAGVVYGVFRVTNISTSSCTVGGAGTVAVAAQGAADPAKVGAARHAAGDAAAGLPDPSLEATGLVLQPGAAYEEKFAFVPSETCPTTGGTDTTSGGTTGGDPSPAPSPSQDAGASGTTDTGTGTSSGVTTQLVTEDGGTADGSVLVTHTAQPGSPSVSATVPGACAGTVYYTGVLAAS